MPAGIGDNEPDVALGRSDQETTWGPDSDQLPPRTEALPIQEKGGKRNIIKETLNSLRDFFGRRR